MQPKYKIMQDLHCTTKKIVIAMAGLPARGKTHISQKINRYLNWLGYRSQVCSVNIVMREKQGVDFDPEIYDPDNERAVQMREEYSLIAVERLIKFLQTDGDVAIFNATNAKSKFRQVVKDRIMAAIPGCQLFWVESICNMENVIHKNIQLTKLSCNQYQGLSKEEAELDYLHRIQLLATRYEPLHESQDMSFIKVIDIGEEIYMHQIDGYLQSKIVSFLMNLHIYERPIYFCRHGESFYSQTLRLGGDSDLTDKGIRTANLLAACFQNEFQNLKKKSDILIFTSMMKRAMTTAEVISQALNVPVIRLKTLDELDYGTCDGLSYPEISLRFPDKIKEREKDRLRFRFPRGESYMDLISRIEPVIFEIERTRSPVVVVAHQDIIRCLFAYFHQNELQEIPKLDIPENVVIKLLPGGYAATETRIRIDQSL